MWHSHNQRNRAVTSLAVEDGAAVPASPKNKKKLPDSVTLTQGATLRLRMTYNPSVAKTLAVRILKADGDKKQVFNAGPYKVTPQGDFSVSMNTSMLRPAPYTIEMWIRIST